MFWIVSVAMVFGLLGIVIGLWANNFEQLTILNVFFITPLSMVGGVFNTLSMLPPWLRWLAFANPFFYFINGIRHAMIGFSRSLGVAGNCRRHCLGGVDERDRLAAVRGRIWIEGIGPSAVPIVRGRAS